MLLVVGGGGEGNLGREIGLDEASTLCQDVNSPILPVAEDCRSVLKLNLKKYKALIFYQRKTTLHSF